MSEPLPSPPSAAVARSEAGLGKRIVLATFGSLGDLHPYLAVALGLQARGHRAVIATSSVHREKVEAEGIGFYPVRPDLPPMDEAQALMARVMDARVGSEVVIGELLAPHVREQYEDLTEAVRGADLLVSHPITYAAPLVGEVQGLRWVSTVLQPMVFASAYEPPVPPASPSLAVLYRLGPRCNAALVRVMKRVARRWVEPVDRFRAELGLPPGENPVFEGQYSPFLNLALFSRALAEPQPDWPRNTLVTGFPFYDRLRSGVGLPPELARFLEAGPPPLVFTLGSSAVVIGGDFYVESAEAARRLGRRAVLLVGKEGWNQLPHPLPEGVLACEYAPHGELFPHAAAIVHQGGVGTTGQALRAGHPMLVVPFAHDQPDNAFRVARRGVGRVLPRNRYQAARVVRELRLLLETPSYAARAAEVGRQVRAENGVETACNALEGCLAATGR
jgi:UDP:flavonoid glycosyltransferase YjiC (YdhE family)